MRYKEPTATKLVEEALRASDDFLCYRMLVQRTGKNMNQIAAACFHLRERHVIDVIIQQGIGWWYAKPKAEDNRTRTVSERAPETRPRKPRTRKALGKKFEDTDTQHIKDLEGIGISLYKTDH